MQERGNALVNAQYGGGSAGARPAASASKEERMEICRQKYEQRLWAQHAGAVSTCSGSRSAAPAPSVPTQLTSASTAALADSRTSLIDNLFRDFDDVPPKQKVVASARAHRLVDSAPCIVGEVDWPAARPARAGYRGESTWFDELFEGSRLARKDNASNDASTTASEDEDVSDRNIPVDPSLVPSTALGADFAVASRVWAGLRDW